MNTIFNASNKLVATLLPERFVEQLLQVKNLPTEKARLQAIRQIESDLRFEHRELFNFD